MTTQTDAARAVAYALNDLIVCDATGGASGTVILSQLINSTAGVSTGRYDGEWIYGVTGALSGVQRQIVAGSYVPSTGQVGVTPGWSAPANGTQYDKTALFPRNTGILANDTSYRTLMNGGAARRLNIRREITVAITTSTRISLATWADWISPERVLSVMEPSPLGRLMSADWREWRVIDGQAPVLELKRPFPSATGNLTLQVVSPLYTWIKASGGAWAESTVGVVAEGDEFLIPLNHIRDATLVEAYRNLMHRSPSRPNGNWAGLFQAQQADCRARLADYEYGAPPPPAAQAGAAA